MCSSLRPGTQFVLLSYTFYVIARNVHFSTWSLTPWCRCSPAAPPFRPCRWRWLPASGSSCCPPPPPAFRGTPPPSSSRRSRCGPQPVKGALVTNISRTRRKKECLTSWRTLTGTPMDMAGPSGALGGWQERGTRRQSRGQRRSSCFSRPAFCSELCFYFLAARNSCKMVLGSLQAEQRRDGTSPKSADKHDTRVEKNTSVQK